MTSARAHIALACIAEIPDRTCSAAALSLPALIDVHRMNADRGRFIMQGCMEANTTQRRAAWGVAVLWGSMINICSPDAPWPGALAPRLM